MAAAPVAAAPVLVAAAPLAAALTSTSTSQTAAVPSDSTEVRIAMTQNDGHDLIATSPGGVSAPGVPDSPAVYFHQDGSTWEVYAGTSCAGPWGSGPVLSGQATPTAVPVSTSQPLRLCLAPPPGSPAGTTADVTVDGTLTALYNVAGSARTVNTLPLETYVADTVPGESPTYWATLGGPGPQGADWGFQELEAQAVAVRSYVLANRGGYGGYADTCDLTCQNYQGTKYVTPVSIAAADDTAGEVMYMPGGAIATTEYSASTGGYTAGAPFQAVPDAGDAVCVPSACNPRHDWTVTVPFSAIQAVWPEYGPTPQVNVTGRNGYGAWTGRVTQVTLSGNGTSGVVTGDTFASALTLFSDWFNPVSETATTLRLTGHGWGSGIGMGQWGALGYAIGTDGGAGNWTYQQILAHYYAPAALGRLPGSPASVGASGGIDGYWLVASDGGIFSFGAAKFYGSMGGKPLNEPVVGMAATPTGGGYWEVASDGGIFSFGSARFYGSMGGKPLNEPIVGMAATPTGGGYWEVASDGGIFTFGDAVFEGSAAGTVTGEGSVAMLPTLTGRGYDVVTGVGTVLPFGDAPQLGDLTTAVPGYPGGVVGGAATDG